MTQQRWAKGLHEDIAAAIRRARKDKDLSAQQVADATERRGHKVSRDVLAGYESGRKLGLDVADLLAISAALQVPLLSLLVSGDPDDYVTVLPGAPMTVADAQVALIGSEPPWMAELRKVVRPGVLSGHGQLSATAVPIFSAQIKSAKEIQE